MAVKVYYWKGTKNFGDLLAPLLLQKFCHLSSQWVEPKDAELVMVGSILHQLPVNWSGIIAGCGRLHEDIPLNLPQAKILSLRGPLTAGNLQGNFTYGDPGLLANELVGYKDKIYNLGVIPHWTDKSLEHNPIFTRYSPKIIRVSDDPIKVIEQIAQCKKIVSSSLHGIILADAFGIPRRIEIPPRALSHPHQEGRLFKWKDYAASIEMDLNIGLTEQPDEDIITVRQHELFDVFQKIKTIFNTTAA